MRANALRFPRPTLRQWLVTFATIGLVASLAIPTINKTILKAHRENARSALTGATQWMERTATMQGRYPEQGAIPPGVLFVKGGRYVMSALSRNGFEYTLTATPTGTQSGDQCGAYRVNQAGIRLQMATTEVPYPMGPLECWQH